RTFIEASPHPVLATALEETADHAGVTATVIPTLRRDHGDQAQLTRALAQAFTAGAPVSWTPSFPASPPPRTIDLPTYPFQHQRYWLRDIAPPPSAAGPGDEEEARFWTAVEHRDLDGLAGTLGITEAVGHKTSLDVVLPVLSRWRRERRDRSAVDSWRYRIEWRPLTADPPAGDGSAGSWLVVRPQGIAEDWAQACGAALEAGGSRVRHLDIDPLIDRAGLAAVLRESSATAVGPGRSNTAEDAPPTRVLSLLPLDEGEEADGGFPGLAGSLTLLQALVDSEIGTQLWVLTRGAVSVGGDDGDDSGPERPVQAQVWGLGRVAAFEHPAVWGGLVDLPPTPRDLNPVQLRAALTREDGEDEMALRPAGVFGRRLVKDPLGPGQPRPDWRPRGAVLVTGGLDGPARWVARWLVDRGADRVLMLAPAGVKASEPLPGVTVIDSIPADAGIGTLVHAAPSGELASLAESTPSALAEAIRASLDGIREAEASCGLRTGDTIVYFSSIAAVWGGRDHGSYVAASAYLDALAKRRRAEGVHTVCVAWGLWDVPDDKGEQAGGRARPHIERARRQGLVPLDPRLAFAALHQILQRDDPSVVIADIEWQRFAPLFTLARRTRLFDQVPAATAVIRTARETDDEAEATEVLRRDLAARPRAERYGILLTLIRSHVATVLRYAGAEEVDPQRPFKDLGFDSLAAVELRNRLRAATGLRLPATLVFDRPTPDALAGWLLGELLPADAGAALPALGRLDDLEAALAVLPPEDARRSGLIDRLQTLAWKYADTAADTERADAERADAERANAGSAEDGTDLARATADEMFALIDRELGV
ncbi:MAG: KR domain-containing protein, partial [Streptosporangiaceae bacterium]|nr:KR domain-containing protein [Streptosporangiaceae bacterium]